MAALGDRGVHATLASPSVLESCRPLESLWNWK